MRILDTIRQPTKWIEPVKEALKETAQNAVNNTTTAVTFDKEQLQKREKNIELAADINANIYASLIETPLTVYNTIITRIAKRKAKKAITDPGKLKDELEKIDTFCDENENFIKVTDVEFDRFKRIAKLKAEKDGGKVNENMDMMTLVLEILAKRAVIFVKD